MARNISESEVGWETIGYEPGASSCTKVKK
jgi:hypothetical protein